MLFCALLGASLFYLSTGLGEIWPLAWVACLPVLWFAYRSQTGWLAGAAAFLAFTFGNAGFLVAFVGLRTALLMTSLAIVGYGLMFALAVLFGRFVYNKLGALWALAAFPACWTGLEYLCFACLTERNSRCTCLYPSGSADPYPERCFVWVLERHVSPVLDR